jgi:glycosyltransferase involved in cell wall biosynthesis
MPSPKVTVLMSVYNGKRFLREAIDSILSQTMPDFDFIIINDGSTDGTTEILASYRDRRMVVVDQQNARLPASLNRGLGMARTELVARMDADDIALPRRLEIQLAEYERLGKPDVLGGQVEFISENGCPMGTAKFPLRHEEIVGQLRSRGGVALAHPTVLYRAESVLRHGAYDSFFRNGAEDYDLWLRMSFECRFANTVHVLLKYRLAETAFAALLKQGRGSRRQSRAWYTCVARQRHMLEHSGSGCLWQDRSSRELVLRELWRRFERSGLHETNIVRRGLKVVRARLRSPGLRWRGVELAARLCLSYPVAVCRFLTARSYAAIHYVSAREILGYERRRSVGTVHT